MRVNESDIDWQEWGNQAMYEGVPYTGEIVETARVSYSVNRPG